MPRRVGYWIRNTLPRQARLRLDEAVGKGLYRGFSDQHQAIFIHIPKTAGVSLKQALGVPEEIGHADYLAFRAASPAKCRSYFKFTFVRNPWDRLLSAYSFLQAGGIPRFDRFWRVQLMSGVTSFEEFVMDRLENAVAFQALHFRPQYSFLCDGAGRMKMDFVGRFETIEEDCEQLAARLGIALPLQRLNRSRHTAYQSAYTPAMRDLVARIYARDIELFGYRFDGEGTVTMRPVDDPVRHS
jgi:hypothetical protein